MAAGDVAVLRTWSHLGIALRNAEFRDLHELVQRSAERLQPLGEPLDQEIGLNRWLARAREEAYSNWFKWLFEQMKVGELIKVLDLYDTQAEEPTGTQPISVVREMIVEEGYEGQQGRIDLVLQLGRRGLVVLEVKKGDAAAGAGKLAGYRDSIEGDQAFEQMSKIYVLLAANSSLNAIEKFYVRCYPAFCRNLRHLAVDWMHSKPPRPLAAAAMLMIAATIETNLLHLSAKRNSFTQSTAIHLKAFIEGEGHE
jgi:hypothetical protein